MPTVVSGGLQSFLAGAESVAFPSQLDERQAPQAQFLSVPLSSAALAGRDALSGSPSEHDASSYARSAMMSRDGRRSESTGRV